MSEIFKHETIIVAPHPDDEIIGVYSILKNKKCIIIYSGDTSNDRREEAAKLNQHFDIKGQLYQNNIPMNFINPNTTFYFPDPIYESHPDHRKWGMIGESLLRSGIDVIFYNTIMNAPYIHEVKEPEKKEELLNQVYPSQSSLWKYDHKYFLFEGRCKWIMG